MNRYLDIFPFIWNYLIPHPHFKKYPDSSVTEEDGAGLSSIYATGERKGCKKLKMSEIGEVG